MFTSTTAPSGLRFCLLLDIQTKVSLPLRHTDLVTMVTNITKILTTVNYGRGNFAHKHLDITKIIEVNQNS